MHGGNARAAALSLLQPLRHCWNFGISTFQRHPFLVKTLSSGVGFAVGDSLTQLAIRRKDEPYDWPRTAAMGGAGMCVAGPLGYVFIVWMESNILTSAPTSRLAITTKVMLDQILGCIMWQAALLSISDSYRASALALWERVQADAKKGKGNTAAPLKVKKSSLVAR